MPDTRRSTRGTIAFAHRGASAHAPENTLAAFRLALELGATGLESDAWLSADGEPVLVHDRTISRPGRRIDVTRQPAADLAELGVPSLRGLYAAIPTEVELSLDLEHPEVARPVLDVSIGAGAIARLWACSADVDLLRALRAANGDVRLVCSTRPRRVPGGVDALVPTLAASGVNVLNMHWRDWTPWSMDRVHRAGLLAFGWDAQEAQSISRLLDLGVDGIYSDWPERLATAIASREEAMFAQRS
jgi:glycerophosphoryl diester phosphodiesterase